MIFITPIFLWDEMEEESRESTIVSEKQLSFFDIRKIWLNGGADEAPWVAPPIVSFKKMFVSLIRKIKLLQSIFFLYYNLLIEIPNVKNH